MSKAMKNPCKVVTGPKTVMSYLNVNEPKVPLGGGSPKFSVSLIIPKSDTVTKAKIDAAVKAAYEEGEGKLKGNGKFLPALENIKTPLRDGDKERKGDPAYANSWFINANSTLRPYTVDADKNPILETSELYSGIIGRGVITLYAFNTNGNRGIAAGLNGIQKLADGTPLGGQSRPEDDLAVLDDDDDDDFLS